MDNTFLIKNICKIGSSKRIYADEYTKDGIPFFRSTEVIELANKKHFIPKFYISQNKYNEIAQKFPIPQNNDILIAAIGANMGTVYFVKLEYQFYFKDGNVIWLRDFDNTINSKYLYYWLSTKKGYKELCNTAIGSAQKALTIDKIGNIKIKVPNIELQQHIVDIIGSLDDKIENNQKLIGRLEKLAELLFDNLYCDAINSNNYKICKLKDYAKTIITGTTPSTKEDKYWGNDINFITIPDMQNNIFIINTERKLANSVKTKFSSRIIPKNTLIVSCIATVGLVSIALQASLTNQQINSIVFYNEKDVYFFYQYLKKIKDYLIQLGSGGSTTLNINKNTFSNIEVKVPNSKLLTSYLNQVEIIYNCISNMQTENLKLINLKQLYLKKFFR